VPKSKQLFFHSVKHVEFCAKKRVIAGNFTALFYSKKFTAEEHRILLEIYDDHVLSETTCRDWFRRSNNNDFDVENKDHSGVPKKFKDEELKALLHEDSCQTLAELAKS